MLLFSVPVCPPSVGPFPLVLCIFHCNTRFCSGGPTLSLQVEPALCLGRDDVVRWCSAPPATPESGDTQLAETPAGRRHVTQSENELINRHTRQILSHSDARSISSALYRIVSYPHSKHGAQGPLPRSPGTHTHSGSVRIGCRLGSQRKKESKRVYRTAAQRRWHYTVGVVRGARAATRRC